MKALLYCINTFQSIFCAFKQGKGELRNQVHCTCNTCNNTGNQILSRLSTKPLTHSVSLKYKQHVKFESHLYAIILLCVKQAETSGLNKTKI